MSRLVTVDLDALPDSIVESLRAVMAEKRIVFARESDTQYPVVDRELEKLVGEIARNAAGAIAMMDEERAVGGCSCGAKFYAADAVDDHECPLDEAAP